jgi:hypothetical protein
MDKELSSALSRQNELVDMFHYIDEASRITKERIKDKSLLSRTVCLFDTIRILCTLNRDKVNQLRLLAGQLLMGVAESNDNKNWALLRREIEYVRSEISGYLN